MEHHNAVIIGELEPLIKLNKDMMKMLRATGPGQITANEARFLTDLYYIMQKNRIRISNQIGALEREARKNDEPPEPHDLLKSWALKNMQLFEDQIKRGLGVYTAVHEMSWFFQQTVGIGPVLSAGLLAHIDIHKAPTAGHIWRFAGLDPTLQWEKGKKRPWNATLKTLCWKIGDSFVKFSGRDDNLYGKVYRERKAYEIQRNDAGQLADQAAEKLETTKIAKDTDAYKSYSEGKLPPGHIDARARRYAVKLFLSHLQWRWWEQEFGEAPPKPYAIAILGHAHLIEPPQIPPGKLS